MRPVKNPLLRRYWLEFNREGNAELLSRRGVLLGCGVTAFSQEDAVQLVRESVFGLEPMPEVACVVEDVDVTTLDAAHVLPNISETVTRGVWYPIGYRPAGGWA
jgi:hypothetical protein